jgi:DNA (cytosine-5)-methyltransferase 1
MGYYNQGFDITGVDLTDQPNYPFDFVQSDALAYIEAADLSGFDLIHASPPCQRYSKAVPNNRKHLYPDWLGPTRAALAKTEVPYVIENVPGAPMRPDLKLCGCQFGLWRLKRERWFECSWQPPWSKPICNHPVPVISIYGKGGLSSKRNFQRMGFKPTFADWRRCLDIDWMSTRGLSEAIPPSYTEYVAALFLDYYLLADAA